MDHQYAVAVGYNFSLVPEAEFNGINLKSVGAIRIQGQNHTLFKGETYEDARKLDRVLDRHEEYPIKDYKLEPVIMRGEAEMVIPGFDKDRDNFFFGGYAMVCDGKVIPFDFSGISWDIYQEGDRVLVPFETGCTSLLTDYYLDDCYEEAYQEVGLRIKDITAEYLSKATAISEFMVCLELDGEELYPEDISKKGSFCIKSLSFSDYEKDYPVDQTILKAFQQKLCEKTIPIEDRIHSAEAKMLGGNEFAKPEVAQER